MSTTAQATSIPLVEFFEQRELVGSRRQTVWVAVRRMAKDETRQAYPYRPVSKYAESRFGGGQLCDDTTMLLNGIAIHCAVCQAPTQKRSLHNGMCPDCDGRSEYNGVNPHLA